MIYTEYGSISDICLVGFISPFLFSLVTTVWVFCFCSLYVCIFFFLFHLSEWMNQMKQNLFHLSLPLFFFLYQGRKIFLFCFIFRISLSLCLFSFILLSLLHSCRFCFFPYMSFCFFLLRPISLISLSSH